MEADPSNTRHEGLSDERLKSDGEVTSTTAPPPSGSTEKRHLELSCVSQDGHEVHFRVQPTTKFKKIMDSYCSRMAIGSDSVRFLTDGTRITENDTPKSLELESGDMIDVVLQQTGGNDL